MARNIERGLKTEPIVHHELIINGYHVTYGGNLHGAYFGTNAPVDIPFDEMRYDTILALMKSIRKLPKGPERQPFGHYKATLLNGEQIKISGHGEYNALEKVGLTYMDTKKTERIQE